LVVEGAIAQLTEPIEEHRTGQRVLRFSLVQADLRAAAQLDVLQSVERDTQLLWRGWPAIGCRETAERKKRAQHRSSKTGKHFILIIQLRRQTRLLRGRQHA